MSVSLACSKESNETQMEKAMKEAADNAAATAEKANKLAADLTSEALNATEETLKAATTTLEQAKKDTRAIMDSNIEKLEELEKAGEAELEAFPEE